MIYNPSRKLHLFGDNSAADGPGLWPHVAQHRQTCRRGSPQV